MTIPEQQLLCAAMKSRKASDIIKDVLSDEDYSPVTRKIFEGIQSYYNRDRECQRIDSELLINQLVVNLDNDKHKQQVRDVVETAWVLEASPENVLDLALEQKKRVVGLELAECLINGDVDQELISKYNKLTEASSLDEAQGDEIVDAGFDILLPVLTNENKIKMHPASLNERIDGGLVKGDAVVVAGRPETGKSAFVITNLAGMAYNGHRVLYAGNEDAAERIITRTLSCLTGRTKEVMLKDPEGTIQVARQRGYSNIVFAHPVLTFSHLRNLVRKHKPDVVVLDQIRNFRVRADNRVGQLERSAIEARNVASELDCAIISVTQVGESGEGKLHLNMGDIDGSKTGIQGACDILLLIGNDTNFDQNKARMVNLAKNKSSGNHDSWPVKIDPALSRYYDDK